MTTFGEKDSFSTLVIWGYVRRLNSPGISPDRREIDRYNVGELKPERDK
jgi:hypothetical protein